MLKRQPKLLSEDAYLAEEAVSSMRHEYVAGHLYAMTGGTLRHNLITGNLFALLRDHLRGAPCRIFVNDAKVRIAKQQAYYYPDLVVSCADSLRTISGAELVVEAPVLIIEVTSPSTEGIDRREKLLAYRTLPSLREYVLIAQDRAEVELHAWQGDTAWEITTLTPGDPIVFGSVDLRTSFEAVYEDSGVPLLSG